MKRIFVIASVLLGTTAACGGGGTDDINLIVKNAPDKTAAADTAKIEMTIKIVGDTTESMGIDGEIDFERELASMNFEIEDVEFEAIIDKNTMYQKIPMLDLPDDKTWVKYSFDDLAELGADAESVGSLASGTQTDPTSTLDQLRGAEDVKEIGEEKIRGTETTHYRTEVDLEDAAKEADAAGAKQIRDMSEKLGISTIPLDVWIDDEGRTWRMSEKLDLSKADLDDEDAQGLKSMTITMDLFDFGTDVDIKVPAAKDAVDFTEVFGNLPGSGNGEGSGRVTDENTALEPKVITDALAGYVREADDVGDTGPSDLEKAIRDDGEDDARSFYTKAGFVAGYQRLWTKGDNEVVDFLYQFKTSSGAQSFFERAQDSTEVPGVQAFAVAEIPNAKGYALEDGEDKGAIVVFVRGGYVSQIVINGSDATPANATKLAKAQYDRLG